MKKISGILLPDYMKEMAELFADEMSYQEGFPKRSEEWIQYYEQFLSEAVSESMIPKMNNPSKPRVRIEDDDHVFEQFLGDNGLFPKSKAPKERAQLLAAIGILTKLYMQRVYGVKSEMEYNYSKKNGGESDAKKVELLKYRRLFVYTSLLAAIGPIFGMSKRDLDEVTKGLEGMSARELRIVDFRSTFILYVYESAKLVQGSMNFARKFSTASEFIEKMGKQLGASSLREIRASKNMLEKIRSSAKNEFDSILISSKKLLGRKS